LGGQPKEATWNGQRCSDALGLYGEISESSSQAGRVAGFDG
jgi:hypothetical protein